MVAIPESPLLLHADPLKTLLWNPVVYNGLTSGITIAALRGDGFSARFVYPAGGLPEGIACPGATIGPGADGGVLTFSPSARMTPWAGPVKIIARATIDGREVTREARVCACIWGTMNARELPAEFRLVSQFFVSARPRDMPLLRVELGEGKPLEMARAIIWRFHSK